MDDAYTTMEFFSVPDTDCVTGLPELDRESLAILTTRRDVVVVRQGRITTYRLDEQQTEPRLEAEFKEPVTAIAESEAGLIVAACGAIHRVTPDGVRELARVDGTVGSLAVAGTSLFAVVGRPGRLDGTLVEVDLPRSAIASERSLRSSEVTLSVDAGGSFLGVSDGTTFRTLRVAPGDPCPDRPAPAPPRPPRPEREDDPCDCHGHGKEKDRPRDDDAERDPTATHPRPDPEPCDPGQSGVPTPDGGRIVGDGGGVTRHPPGSSPRTPFDPCRSHLFFEVHRIQTAGAYLIAADREARNVAVLASTDLRVLHQAQYRHGAVVLSHPAQPLMMVFDHANKAWERKYFGEIELSPIEIEPSINPDVLALDTMTWVGSPLPVLKGNYAPATGHKRVLVIPVVDPGQAFNDADLGKFAAYMKRAGFDHVQKFYRENSFGALSGIDFTFFGAHAGPGGPVRLPRPIAEYYNPLYVGAHVDLVKTGLTFPATVVFDGRERMTLNVQPMTGGRKASTLDVRFTALLCAGVHNEYPAQIQFLGTETGTISIKRPNGANAVLNLKFTPELVNIAGDTEVKAGLAKLETYLQGVIAAAAAAAGISGPLFAKPEMRRVDQGEGGLGLLVTTISHALATGPKLEVNSVTYSGAKDPLGLGSAFEGRMTLTAASDGNLQRYLDFVTVLAQEAAGFNHTQRRLAPDPVVEVKAGDGKLMSQFFIVDEDGGPGATMSVSNAVEMGTLFDTATGVPNTNVTAGRSATPKDGEAGADGLVSDVFTAAVDRLAPPGQHLAKKEAINLFFMPYDCIIIGVVHPAKADATDGDFVQPHEMWSAGPSSWTGHFRAVNAPRTAVFRPHPKEIQRGIQWILAPLQVKPDTALFCHEFGHTIGLDDLYKREAGYREDLIYLQTWAMMDHHGTLSHHCGYHKWQTNWIPNSRIHTIGRPKEDETLVQEVLLVPVEHWHDKDALVGAARAAFALPNHPVAQLVELSLGGDADVFGLIEARQKGAAFSQKLPADPAVLVTHCIVWWDKTRYAFNGRYRAPAHLLHADNQLRNAGDSFDLARGKELPIKGIVVSIVDRKDVAGVQVFLIRVERKHSKEFIDLFFSTSDPYYKNPDLWVDWTGNNGPDGKTSSLDQNRAHIYPPGQPVDQGEKIVVPDTGEEAHWMVARLRNNGNVRAEQVKVNFSVCDPPGTGDNGNFKVRDTVPLVQVPPTGGGEPIFVKSAWPVPAGFKGHTCIMVEIADLKVPLDHTGAALASDDVWQANNRAQKNVDQIGPRSSSPFEPVDFEFSVNNSARWPEVAYLEPEGLPYGMTLTISPKRRKIAAGETAIFRCRLELDDKVIDASCRGDHNFRINAWRVDEDSAILWGGVEYQVRPRKRSTTDLGGSWFNDEVEITGHVAPGNIAGSVRIRLAYTGHHARWVSADLKPGGTFAYKEKAPPNTVELLAIALFEGNKYYSESRSPQRRIMPPPPIR
jgi:hypothetical protein